MDSLKKTLYLSLFLFLLCSTVSAQDTFQYEQSELTEEATFKEGKPALYKFVTDRIQAIINDSNREKFGNNRYLLTFHIESDGRISDVNCYPEEMEPMFKIVLEELYDKSYWNAGKIDGEEVNSTYLFPIQIKFQ